MKTISAATCRLWLALIAAAAPLFAAGCGADLSQDEMRRMAIRRTDDVEEEVPAPPADPAATDSGPQQDVAVSGPPPSSPAPTTGKGTPQSPDAPAAAAGKPAGNEEQPKPQTVVECRQRTIDNLTVLGEAFQRYLEEKGEFPTDLREPGRGRGRGIMLLSWRVRLLPYLGFTDLYKRFRQDQPWNSPHNLKLVEEIPPIYTSPERFDKRTNYLVVSGTSSLYQGGYSVLASSVTDGLSHTLMLVEVDDELAVPWTQPADYNVDARQNAEGIGSLRKGDCFVVWADGRVGQVERGALQKNWRMATSVDAGDPFSSFVISGPPLAEPPAVPSDSSPTTPKLAGSPETDAATAAVKGAVPGDASTSGVSPVGTAQPGAGFPSLTEPDGPRQFRRPIPDAAALEAALAVLRGTYHLQYQKADNDDAKKEVVDELKKELSKLASDDAGRYATLDLIRRIAAEIGDLQSAWEAARQTADEFDVQGVLLFDEVLTTTQRLRLSHAANDFILDNAEPQIDRAMRLGRFDIAKRVHQSLVSAARREGDARRQYEIESRRKRIDEAEKAHEATVAMLGGTTPDPNDAEGIMRVGSYYCFVRGEWEDGLALLRRCGDPELAEVAEWELQHPQDVDAAIRIADRWWDLSQKKRPFSEAMRGRARYWYGAILPRLEPGIQRVKAEYRLKDEKKPKQED